MSSIPIGPVIIEGITSFILLILTIQILRRYYSKKSKITLLLYLYFLFLFLAALTSFMGRLIVYTRTLEAYNTRPFAIGAGLFSIIGIFIIVAFAQRLFFSKNRFILHCVSIFQGLSLGYGSYILINYSAYEQVEYEKILFIIASGIHAFFGIICYGLVFYFAFKASRREKDVLRKRCAEAISIYGIVHISAMCFLIFDPLLAKDFSDYTIFYFIGWTMLIIACIIAYIGYIQPWWFKKIVLRKISTDKQVKVLE